MKYTFTSNLLQSFVPRGKEVEEFSGELFEFAQRFGLLPPPGLPAGNHWHPHLLHLPSIDIPHSAAVIPFYASVNFILQVQNF